MALGLEIGTAETQWLQKEMGKLLGQQRIWAATSTGAPGIRMMQKLRHLFEQATAKYKSFGTEYTFADMIKSLEGTPKMAATQKGIIRNAGKVAGLLGDKTPTAESINQITKVAAEKFSAMRSKAVADVAGKTAAKTAASNTVTAAVGGTVKETVKPVAGGASDVVANVGDDVAAGGKGIIGKLGRFFRGGTDKLKVVGEGMEKKAAMSGAVGTGIGMAGLALTIADFMARNQEANMQVEQLQLEGKKLSEMAGIQNPTSMYHEAMLPQLQQQTQMGHQAIMSKLMGGGAGSQLADGEMQI